MTQSLWVNNDRDELQQREFFRADCEDAIRTVYLPFGTVRLTVLNSTSHTDYQVHVTLNDGGHVGAGFSDNFISDYLESDDTGKEEMRNAFVCRLNTHLSEFIGGSNVDPVCRIGS